MVWSLDAIVADLAAQQSGSKGSKKAGQPATSKSQVDIPDDYFPLSVALLI